MKIEKLVPTPLLRESERPPVRIVEEDPKSLRFRTFHVLMAIASLVLKLLRLKIRGALTAYQRASEIRGFIETMGGLWIKLGQLIALRPDVFGEEICSELSKLQDHTVGFPFGSVRAALEDRLGCRIEECFSEFDEVPIAAASIAQVHRARLKLKGRKVVVKVQKPSARAMFDKDIRLISWFVWGFRILGLFGHMRWGVFMDELRLIIEEELDYRFEAASINRVGKSLRSHDILVPKVYGKYCNDMMLTMELFEGVQMSDYIAVARFDPERVQEWQRKNRINPAKVARTLILSLLRQIFEDNLFHADQHPGNIILFRKNRVGLIDLGSVGVLDVEFNRKYQLFLSAVTGRQYEKAADYLLMFSPSLPNINLREVRGRVAAVMRRWEARTSMINTDYHERSLANLSQEMSNATAEYRLEPNWTFLKVGRAWATLDASVNYLCPELDYGKMLRRYAVESTGRKLWQIPWVFKQIPELATEAAVLIGPRIREGSLVLQSNISKASRIAALFVRTSVAATILMGTIFLWTFIQRYYDAAAVDRGLVTFLHPILGGRAESLVARLGEIPQHHVGLWILGIVLFLCLMARMIVRILVEPEQRSGR